MLPSSRIKHVSSLKVPKYRELHQQSITEGSKLIREMLMSGFPFEEVFATGSWMEEHPDLVGQLAGRMTLCSGKEMERMSVSRSPQGVLAVFNIPEEQPPLPDFRLSLYLDCISDPGNLGTILRIADWFGIDQVISSPGSVNLFNPKVVQASMGSVFRVRHSSCTLKEALETSASKPAVFGTVMNGEMLQDTPITIPAIVAIGNESEGLSAESLTWCTHRVTIPGKAKTSLTPSAESLNAAMATAVLCYYFTTTGQ